MDSSDNTWTPTNRRKERVKVCINRPVLSYRDGSISNILYNYIHYMNKPKETRYALYGYRKVSYFLFIISPTLINLHTRSLNFKPHKSSLQWWIHSSTSTQLKYRRLSHGWPYIKPNRIAHNLTAHYRAAHNPAAWWCAGSVVHNLPRQQCRLAKRWPKVGTIVPTLGQR